MNAELQKEYDALGLPWECEDGYCNIIDREMNLVVDASETTAARAEFIVMASNVYHAHKAEIEELTAINEGQQDALNLLHESCERYDSIITDLTSEAVQLRTALSALWGEWTDQKSQFGDEHLWKRHEDPEAINLAKEALAEKGTE